MRKFCTPASPRTTALPCREEMPFSSVKLGKSWHCVLWGTRGEVHSGIHLLRGFLGKGKVPSWIPKGLSPWIWPQLISDWGVKVIPWCPMCSHAHDIPQWPTTLVLGTWAWRCFAAPVWHWHRVFQAWEAFITFTYPRSFQIRVCWP